MEIMIKLPRLLKLEEEEPGSVVATVPSTHPRFVYLRRLHILLMAAHTLALMRPTIGPAASSTRLTVLMVITPRLQSALQGGWTIDATCNRTAECEFVRKLEDTYYDTLRSHPYSRRYLAISTSGRIKRAREVKEHLGKEHFFLFPPLPRKRTNSIIKKYQKQLGRPLQRCAGYNEYSVAVAGDPRDARERVTDVTTTTTTTTTTSTTTTTTTTVLPTTTVTTAPRSPSSARRCRKVKGKMRCRRCRTVKGKRKCRKSPKRCKNKKCKRKRKKQKHRKKDEEKRETRIRKRGERRRKAGTSSSPQAGGRGRRKKVEDKSETTGRRSHSRRTSRRRRPSGGGGSRRIRHQRRRNKTARTSATPTTSTTTTTTTTTTTPKPPSERRSSKTASGSSKAGLVPLTRPPRRPFPRAPSSARPYRVRHGHNAGRGRRPRGRRRPLTSTDA
ncbi:hypothetical protein E2C01_018758 [Portunus trituberculatus]|uniref:Uncharacterized protein n=1 Tax=Portunus trituberculatus TaxID=210409 RepID=A0A5B7DXD4_PORTR|nr:hypothetical protein [Portunus trituberculatus]